MASAAGVQNIGDNSSAPRKPSSQKWVKLDWLRLESTIKPQRLCLLGTVGKSMGVRTSALGAGFSGLVHCGRTLCPNCGPRIGAQRREDINLAVKNWRAVDGQEVLFGTLTLRHHRAQSFEQLSGAMSGCWAAATGGRGWVKDRKTHGIVHTLRVWEEKWSIENGWHLHVHFLLFVAAGETAPAAPQKAGNSGTGATTAGSGIAGLLVSMFTRWASKAKSQGLGAPLMRGQDLHLVTGDADDVLGSYFAKQTEDSARSAAEDMAWELTGGNGKSRGDSFTPGEILNLAVGGDPEMARLWAEYEQGMVKRRTIAWSRGLRDAAGLDEEKTDQQIVDEDQGGETVLSMSSRTWHKFARTAGARFELLRLVGAEGPEAAVEWLAELGHFAVLGEWDTDDE